MLPAYLPSHQPSRECGASLHPFPVLGCPTHVAGVALPQDPAQAGL